MQELILVSVVILAALFLLLTSKKKPIVDSYTQEIEYLIHQEVNRVRKAYGLSALAWDDRLAELAREHSKDMIIHGYFDHVNKRKEGPGDRARKKGIQCSIGENLYKGYLYERIFYRNGIVEGYKWYRKHEFARKVVESWLNSPGHRKNLLDPSYKKEGIGVARSEEWLALVSQELC